MNPGTLEQLTCGEPEILREVLDQVQSPGIAAFFRALLNSAKSATRAPAGFVRMHARCDVFLGLPREVVAQLLVEIAVERLS